MESTYIMGVNGVKVSGGSAAIWGSKGDLIKTATTPGTGGVTPVGRAFQKHAGSTQRAGSFTGEVNGNASKNTQQGLNFLEDILDNPNSSYDLRNTKAFGEVLDVRTPDGTGVRFSSDGKKFIGFLEKFTNKN